MIERIGTRLNYMIDWLEDENINYTKEEFKKDISRIMNAIHEAEFVDIITIKQANELEKLVMYKTTKYFN